MLRVEIWLLTCTGLDLPLFTYTASPPPFALCLGVLQALVSLFPLTVLKPGSATLAPRDGAGDPCLREAQQAALPVGVNISIVQPRCHLFVIFFQKVLQL